MDKVKGHIVEGAQFQLDIIAHNEPGAGGGHQFYSIRGFDTVSNEDAVDESGYRSHYSRLPIAFQNKRPGVEDGMCGITMEALLAICQHRLQGFQSGPHANDYNGKALEGIDKALEALNARTSMIIKQDRQAREEAEAQATTADPEA